MHICNNQPRKLQAATPNYDQSDLLLIAEGDEKAFFNFYSYHASQLRPFIIHYTGSATDTEDIIQETFIRVWLNRDRLASIENIPGWIYRIAARVYLDQLDREIKRRKRKDAFGRALYGTGFDIPAERTQVQEIHHRIRLALNTLSEQKQIVFQLNREKGLKPAQIAAQLNIPVGTVKNQLSAALREVREQLLASGYGPITILYLQALLAYYFSKISWFPA
ncbi:RNA polymerase sigma factor [Paraflavitalea speifideaquila]|uniref:RNA polymerase sigma factor n=1 Tax=Paraflavitalea speifideaquila TaxID=3076558 RepID=UPI0028E21986|nr:RNA polymerase sigma factor [Paraflavitalea speifideiaquila]